MPELVRPRAQGDPTHACFWAVTLLVDDRSHESYRCFGRSLVVPKTSKYSDQLLILGSEFFFFFLRKPAIYSTRLSKTPVDRRLLRMLPLVFREFSRALFRFSRVVVGLFVHISSSEDIMIFSSKILQDPLFLASVLTNSLISEPCYEA